MASSILAACSTSVWVVAAASFTFIVLLTVPFNSYYSNYSFLADGTNNKLDGPSRGKSTNHNRIKGSEKNCPTANIDIFIATYRGELPVLAMLLRSLDAFMPCRGHTHILLEPQDVPYARAWVDFSDPGVHIHQLVPPVAMAGYLASNWAAFHADDYAHSVGSNPKYIMFLDADVAMALPVTCASLFNSQGRILWATTVDTPGMHDGYGVPAEQMVGKPYPTNFMYFLPVLYPRHMLERLRRHVAATLKAGEDFDASFVAWHKNNTDRARRFRFCQYCVMGLYAMYFEPDAFHFMECAALGSSTPSNFTETGCASYISPGVHYPYRYCSGLNACLPRSENDTKPHPAMYYQRPKKRPSMRDAWDNKFAMKFSPQAVDLIEDLVAAGNCYKEHLMAKQQHGTAAQLPPGCSKQQATTIHPEARPYQKLKVTSDMQAHWDQTFTPDAERDACF